MTTYYWTIAIAFVFSFFAELFAARAEDLGREKLPTATKVFLFLAAGTLIFVAGFRYYVGTDFGYYYKALRTLPPRLNEAVRTFDEPGFPLLATIVSWFTKDGSVFILICSLITIGLFLLTAYRNEKSYIMITLLFVLEGVWDGTFNGVRQYLAAAILFAGHRLIYDKKLIRWLLVVLLAMCFHVSAIVMATLFFLLRNKVNVRNILLLAAGTYIVAANYDTIFSFVGLLKDSDMTLNGYSTRSVNILRILVACAPAIMALAVAVKKDLTKEETFYTNALVIHGAAMIAASNSAYLARIGIYTSPYVIVALPKLLRVENKYVEMLMRVGVLLLYAIYWYQGIFDSATLANFRWSFWH